ncbi:unnamed protein product, partial [Closterium sp. NIES-54]
FPDATEIPHWGDLHTSGVAIFDLDFDAILAAMYNVSISAEGDSYVCVPPDSGIEATALGARESAAPGASESAALGANESALSGTASAQVLHTFTLDSGASRSFFRDRTTLTPLSRPVAVSLADPSGGPVLARYSTVPPCLATPSGSLSGLYLPSFSTNLRPGQVQSLPPARVASCPTRPSSGTTVTPPCLVSEAWPPVSLSLFSPGTSLPFPRGLPLPAFLASRGGSAPLLTPPSFPPTESPLQTLHMDVWDPARVRGQGHKRYFLLVVDDYSRYTTVFPLRSKAEVTEVLIDWIRVARLQLRESFGSDFPVLRLHSDRGGEFSSDLLRAFCRSEGIRQTFTLPASPQQNGIAEPRIGMVMDVARTTMIHAAAPHFQWPFAVQYAAHQINLQPRASLPKTSPTLRWAGKVGDASAFRVWGSRAFVRDLSADKVPSRAVPCVFLGFPPDAPGWQFYHPTSRRVLSSPDVTFDELVPYYRLFPYRTAPLPPPPLFLAPGLPPVDPLPPQGPANSGVSQVDAVEPYEVAADSIASGGVEPKRAEPGGAGSGGAEPERAEPGGSGSGACRCWTWRSFGCAAGAEGSAAAGGSGAGGAAGAGTGGSVSAGGAGATGPGGARTGGTGAAGPGGAPGAGATGGSGAGGAAGVGATGGTGAEVGVSAGGPAGAGAAGGTGAGGAAGVGADAGGTGVVPAGSRECPPPVQSESQLQLVSPLPAPSPYSGPTGGLAERREPESRPASPVRTARTSRRFPRPRPPAVPGMHQMTLRPSTAPQRVPLPSPPESSLPALADLASDSLRAASPTVTRFLATVFTDPSFESTASSALVTELVNFAAHCRLDYAACLVAESASVCPPSVGGECALSTDVLEDREEEFQCFAATLPHLVSTLLAPEGDPDAPDTPTPRSYAEAIEGPYPSQWQAAMDAEMAS